MSSRAYLRVLLSALAITGLPGCGWHAAGERPLPAPLRVLYIEFSNPYDVTQPPLETALVRRLVSRGAKVVSNPRPGASVLKLYDLQESRQVLAIGQDGTAVEYRLTTRISYQLSDGSGVLVPGQTQSISSEYSFNAAQILAKEAEAQRLRGFTQKQLADLLLLRLESQLDHRAATAAPAGAEGVLPPL